MSWRSLLSAASLVLLPSCIGAAHPKGVVPFVEDDFARALAMAKQSHRPLFIDVWAEWCAPCMDMKRDVFTDARLVSVRDRFVWLAVDRDKASNEELFKRYPTPSLPILLVIDPESERVVVRRTTFADAPVLITLLETSEAVLARGDLDEAAVAEQWATALETAAERDPAQRHGFDQERLKAYLALGAPERAIPMFEDAERLYPKWYGPSLELARLHLGRGSLDDAKAAIERAAARVGTWTSAKPTLDVFGVAAEIARARSDAPAERAALAAALSRTEKLHLHAEDRATRANLRTRLDELR
jgi:thiol-disulfide isomerase/thioredoxin